MIHLDVFPFTKDFTDTTRIFRFRRVGPGDTISFRSAVPHVWPSLRSNFTFRRAVGLQSFSYNSGTVDVFDTASHDLLGSVITSTNETTERRGPESFDLSQNYPNPFNPSTNVEFRVKNMGFVSLKVYDVLGREVATLVNEVKPPGVYEVEWDATGMASGVYFYRLSSGAFVQTRKMIVAR